MHHSGMVCVCVNTKWNTYINALERWVVSWMYKGKPSRSTTHVWQNLDPETMIKDTLNSPPKKVSSILNYQFLVFRICYIETIKINEVTNSLLHQHTSQKLVEKIRNNKHLDHNKSIKPAKTQLYKEMTNLATWRCYVTSLCLQDHLGRLHLEWQSVAMALILIRCWLTHGVATDMKIWWVYMLYTAKSPKILQNRMTKPFWWQNWNFHFIEWSVHPIQTKALVRRGTHTHWQYIRV